MRFSDLVEIAQGDTMQAAVAGAAGGLVRWIMTRDDWRSGSLSLIVGAVCAVYIGPLAAPLVEPILGRVAPDGGGTGFSAFLIGIGGISISALLIGIFRAREAAVAAQAAQTALTAPQEPRDE
jgi:Na+/melibiose symporter-like transporter